MKKQVEKELIKVFRTYKQNKKELETNYNIPVPSGVAYDRISVKPDKSKNPVEKMTVEYISKREELFRKVFIVDEVNKWFQLEGHGRERFIKAFMIDGESWVKMETTFHMSPDTINRWKRDVLEKSETVAKWVGFL